jgi:hypothetical protein
MWKGHLNFGRQYFEEYFVLFLKWCRNLRLGYPFSIFIPAKYEVEMDFFIKSRKPLAELTA